jgi:hypothetical protein
MCLGIGSLLGALLARRAFTRFTGTAVAAASAAAAAALPVLAFLHRGARLARRLICARLTRRPGLLLVATLLVHILAGALAISTATIAGFGTRLARGTIATRRALLL